MNPRNEQAVCAGCQKSIGGAAEMCLNIGGKHLHVLICINCHVLEIQRFVEATGAMLVKQQKLLDGIKSFESRDIQ